MLLSALAALLLSGPPAALAEDPAPAGQFDARDTNQDGEVSGKERRRARRADRRARRGEKNANGTAAVDEEQDAADADASAERGQAATSAAANAAAALKSSMPSLDAAAMPGDEGGKAPGGAGGTSPGSGAGKTAPADFHASGAAGGGGFKPSAFSAGASGDPSKPKAPSDFVLAARSGYEPAFAKTGLKLSADGRSVVRADGSPATADDYARLQREIGSMPGAVSRRADFFNAISPGHYADLKREYKSKKDDPNFKDVGTTEGDRDFVHTATCDKLSGGCNENVEKGSYKKGDYVAPEDLDAIWGALQKQIDGSSAAEGGMSLSEKSSSLARDKAVAAAEALSDDPRSPGTLPGKKTETGGTPGTASPATVTQAVVVAQKFFSSVKGFALPGRDPRTGEGGNPLPLIVAGSLAALGLGVLILRRKG